MIFNLEEIKKLISKTNRDQGLPEYEIELNDLLSECKSQFKNENQDLIKKAFYTCMEVHKNKMRKSGEPYYKHPLAVAKIVLNEIPLDSISVAAALLHDVLDDNELYTYNDLKSEFGQEIADIVVSVRKIKFIESYKIDQLDQVEKYRKLLLSLFKDVRIILLKLGDRLHNMRTLEHLNPIAQQRIAKETLEIYASFANRFGLRNLKWELEDLAFKYLNSDAYYEIRGKLNSTRAERVDYIKRLKEPIIDILDNDEFLKKHKIKYEISGRPKHIYSIFNKIRARQKPMEELYDLFAVRVKLDTKDPMMCFYVYGLIGSIYAPVPETFKDYVSSPKKNGYSSIHTGVIGPDNKAVEVQIRTFDMHDIAENGVAAHFQYKPSAVSNTNILDEKDIQDWIYMVREIFENIGDEDTEELLKNLPRDIFSDEILVFTPDNEYRSMPKDASPLDFAYGIHSEIGNHYIGAKVNGRIIPIDYKLQNGDRIEILTSKNQKPKREWLKIVKTHRAKSYIHSHIRQEKNQYIATGKKVWKETIEIQSMKLSDEMFGKLLNILSYKHQNELYYGLGTKDIEISKVIQLVRYKLKDGFAVTNEQMRNDLKSQFQENLAHHHDLEPQINRQVNIRIANCCNPIKNDPVVAIKNKTEDIVIHRNDCKEISYVPNEMILNSFVVDWESIQTHDLEFDIVIKGEDRPSMLNEITSSILSMGEVNINKISFDTFNSIFEGIISVNVGSVAQIKILFDNINKVKGIISVDKLKK